MHKCTLFKEMSDNEFSEIGAYQIRMHLPDKSKCSLDLNKHLIQNPESTFFLKFQGHSIEGTGIFKNDILVVDRSRPIEYGNLLIAVLNGTFKLGRLVKIGQGASFISPDTELPLFDLDNFESLEIWGTVSSIIHKL